MSKTFYQKPPFVSWSIWKQIFLVLGVIVLWTFLIWIFSLPIHIYYKSTLSLSLNHILLGGMWLFFALWMRWTWSPRRKHRQWYHWLGNLFSCVYISGLLLGGAISYLNVFLHKPLSLATSITIVALFFLAWLLPMLNFTLAKRLYDKQNKASLVMLGFGAPAALMVIAGILGANFGLRSSSDRLIVVFAFLLPIAALGLAQYWAFYLWRYRPWAKEEE